MALKALGAASALALVFILAAAAPVFADTAPVTAVETSMELPGQSSTGGDGGLRLLPSSYPKDGFTHMNAQNSGLKCFFDGNVTDATVLESNLKCFTLRNSKGKTVPTRAVAGNKYDNYILVIAEPKNATRTLDSNSDYELTISGQLASSDHRTLGNNVVIGFKTVDQAFNTRIYMLIMALMLAGMVGMSVLQAKRKKRLEAEIAAGVKGEKVNPYKFAKEKGITVDEAMAHLEKEKRKRAKRLGVSAEELDKKIEEAKRKPTTPGAKRVQGPRPISAAGGKYKTGRKALAEKKKREAAAKRASGTTHPKNRNKNKKGKPKR